MIPFHVPYLHPDVRQNWPDFDENSGLLYEACGQKIKKSGAFSFIRFTPSCTDALEASGALCQIKPGDSFMVPAYTYVTSASSFMLRGAIPVFLDSTPDSPLMDIEELERKYHSGVKALIVVHYAGMCVNMEKIMEWAKWRHISVIEDAAHGIGAFYQQEDKLYALGSLGDCGAISFHHTKNIQCGEGGVWFVNRHDWHERANILWNKGTNVDLFRQGKIPAYEWVDVASSWQMSSLHASFLNRQLDFVEAVTQARLEIWHLYHDILEPLRNKEKIKNMMIPKWSRHNGHIYYIVTHNKLEKDSLMAYLLEKDIQATVHYQALNRSAYWHGCGNDECLPHAEMFSDCLIRLPLYMGMPKEYVYQVCQTLQDFFNV